MGSKVVQAKITVVGDGSCGKTSVLLRFVENKFSDVYTPTVFENSTLSREVGGCILQVAFWDTAGQEDYSRLISLAYPNTDVLIICYSIPERTTFRNVEQRWIAEAATHCPNVPIVLVGNKMDMRSSKDNSVSLEEGKKLAERIGAVRYYECSAKTEQGIKETLDDISELIISIKSKTQKKKFICC